VRKWAPEETGNNWAEPLIGSLILSYHKLPNTLVLLNKYPEGQAHAPDFVFQKILTFKEFTSTVKEVIKSTSIMIDDGHYALSIVGFREPDNATVEFLFADPHLVNNREHQGVGLYRKAFDLEGKPKGDDSRNEFQIKESLYNVYEKL
jgi:hypothetical protein